LRKRFVSEALHDVENALTEIDSLEPLSVLLDRAVDCRSLAEFRAELPALSQRR
jgi:hypothetical protein